MDPEGQLLKGLRSQGQNKPDTELIAFVSLDPLSIFPTLWRSWNCRRRRILRSYLIIQSDKGTRSLWTDTSRPSTAVLLLCGSGCKKSLGRPGLRSSVSVPPHPTPFFYILDICPISPVPLHKSCCPVWLGCSYLHTHPRARSVSPASSALPPLV